MAEKKTAAEVEAEYLNTMGPDLGPIYYGLYKEVVWLHARWLQYRKLFASPDTVALLNRNTGFIFKLVQDGLWEATLLHIARLTDPPQSAGKDNLSLQRLLPLIVDAGLRSRVQNLVDEAVSKAQFAREHRHKKLAHLDLLHATTPSAVPIQRISRAQLEEMLAAIREVLNCLEQSLRNSTVAFDHFISHSDADQLVAVLAQAENKSAL